MHNRRLTLRAYAEYIDVPKESVPAVIAADPKDDPALACAVVGKADYLVTYDPHFDVLGGEYQGIKILVRGDVRE